MRGSHKLIIDKLIKHTITKSLIVRMCVNGRQKISCKLKMIIAAKPSSRQTVDVPDACVGSLGSIITDAKYFIMRLGTMAIKYTAKWSKG